MELRDALAGDGKLDWSANESIHFWDGVTLGGSPLRVRGLRLVDSGLMGQVPHELGKLTALRTLNLSYNDLEDGILGELGDLAVLRYLYLHHNQLTGAVPAALGGLADLRHLILNDNDLTGDIPHELGDLRNLEYLHLDGNLLSGCIPQTLIDNSELKLRTDRPEACPKEEPLAPGTCMNGVAVVDPARNPELVHDCNVLMKIRDVLSGDAHLSWSVEASIYWWDGVRVGGSPARVESLALNHRRLTGEVPSELAELTGLVSLRLDHNELTGHIPAGLSELPALSDLALQNNLLTGVIPPTLGALSNLRSLRLYGNSPEGEHPRRPSRHRRPRGAGGQQ